MGFRAQIVVSAVADGRSRACRWRSCTARSSPVAIAAGVFGLGLGLVYAAITSVVVQSVPATQTGIASGMNANLRTIGSAIGAAADDRARDRRDRSRRPAGRVRLHRGLRDRRRARGRRRLVTGLGMLAMRASRRAAETADAADAALAAEAAGLALAAEAAELRSRRGAELALAAEAAHMADLEARVASSLD